MLSCLAAQQGTAGLSTRCGDALDNSGNPVGVDVAACNVVGDEPRLSTHHDEIVDEHADEVKTNGVVNVHGLGDGCLSANPISRGSQHRVTVLTQDGSVEEASEAAQAAKDLWTTGGGHVGLHQVNGALTSLNVDSGTGVGGLVAHCCSWFGLVWVASASTARAETGTGTG